MSTRQTRVNRDNNSGEKGAILLELAMVVPLLVVLVLGMVEMGMAWREKVTVTQASRQGARTVSHLGPTYSADREALQSLFSVFDGDMTNRIEYVIIFDASAADGSLPPGCLPTPAGPHTNCNFYTQAMLGQLADATVWNAADGCPDPLRYDAGWCPTSRSDDLANPDHVGVMVQVDHDWLTGIFPSDGTTLTSKTVMRLEPEAP